MTEFSLVSLNVGRMKEYRKRDDTFRYLRSLKAQIICIQEHNCPEEEQSNWEKEWGGKIYWSAHNATLLSKNLSTYNVQTAARGQILQTDITIGNTQLTITNIYGPSYTTEKRLFYRDFPDLQAQPFHVVVGDLNIFPDGMLDHTPPSRSSPQLWNMLTASLPGLIDLVRHFSPDKRITTHTQKVADNLIQTRIDHILASSQAVQTACKPVIQHAPYSDHKSLTVHFQLQKNTRSKGMWKLNNALLQDVAFRKIIAKVIKDTLEQERMRNPQEHWDIMKQKVKAAAQVYGKDRGAEKRKELSRLQVKLSRLLELSAGQTEDLTIQNSITKTELEIKDWYDIQAEAMRVRSRAEWIEKGEKMTKFFFDKFKARESSTPLTLLRDAGGSLLEEEEHISQHVYDFYAKLYTPEATTDDQRQDFLRQQLPQLSPEVGQQLMLEIQAEELYKGLAQAPRNKAPGPDGLSYEFYSTFKDELGVLMAKVLSQALKQGAIPRSFYRSQIILLHKKGKDPADIGNWRPISLANTDSKVLSRLITKRLAPGIAGIIHTDQTGFVPGRHIAETALNVRTILEHANRSAGDSTAALLMLDQQKAYDRVHHGYMERCLRAFGFPEAFITATRNLYSNLSAAVSVNRKSTKTFPLLCGVRQGDPLSPFLYNITFEPFLARLRQTLRGISIDRHVFKVGAFADDATVAIAAPEEMPVFLQVVDQYQQASNARLSHAKTQGVVLAPRIKQ